MRFFNTKGQNTAEYAILIALVVAAAVAMQTYVKRSMQGGIKFAVDKVKKTNDNRSGQYEPYYLESFYDTTQSAYKDTAKTGLGGEVTRTMGVGALNADGTVVDESALHKTTRGGYQKTSYDKTKETLEQ